MKAILMISAVLCCGLFAAWLSGFRVNCTPSLPYGIYQICPQEQIARADLVTFCLEDDVAAFALARNYLQAGSCSSEAQPLLKIVAALPGDPILKNADGISINGQLWPNSQIKIKDSQGRLIASQLTSGLIPAGMALLLSNQHEGSFDSRYFGLVDVGKLQRVREVFTWL